jgi:hypothetical protein
MESARVDKSSSTPFNEERLPLPWQMREAILLFNASAPAEALRPLLSPAYNDRALRACSLRPSSPKALESPHSDRPHSKPNAKTSTQT